MLVTTRDQIALNYGRILEEIGQAAVRAGRRPSEVELVVVTKGHPAETVQAAYAAGARVFGENYAEEGAEKRQASALPADARWDMIGHVQSRKADIVARHFDRMHSLDSLKLAQKLDARLQSMGAGAAKRLPVLLECNVSGEESKFGFSAWDENAWDALLPDFERIAALPHCRVQGLMTMAPFFDQPEAARPYFQRLRRLQAYLARHLPQADWSQLSMGMSGDFVSAIEEGATIVRIGTAIVGPRQGV